MHESPTPQGVIEMVDGANRILLMNRRWPARVPDGAAPRGRVVFLHGIVSHSGWYAASCQALSQSGYEVHFPDRRGSGGNPHRRGDVDQWTVWLDDLACFLEALPRDVPIVLGGISWGGKLAAVLAARRPDLIDALALICPGIYASQFPSPAKYRLLEGLAKLGLAGMRVPIPLKNPSLFTDVARWQEFIRKDSLTLRKITIRFALADRELTQLARMSAADIQTPTWMVLAARDRIVDNRPTRVFFDAIGSMQKQLTVYDEAAHTFEFEPDPRVYFRDLVQWVDGVG